MSLASPTPARPPRTLRALRLTRPRRGYTILEVMMALGILAAGTAGVISMQRATLLGNTAGARLATANYIAATWMERLRMDAVQWTNPGGVSNLASTWWLNSATGALGAWFSPAAVAGQGSPTADLMGEDIFAGVSPTPVAAFCTEIRVTQTYPGLIRTEVRVVWNRDGSPVAVASTPSICSILPANIGTDLNVYGSVYATSAVMSNPSPT